MLDNKFNPQEAEPRLYKMWEDSGAFKPRAAKPGDTKDDNFSIVIPPPNVTGSLHMGHAVNNTIQDIRKWWSSVNLPQRVKRAKI